MTDTLQRLQAFYVSQCNGDWEHSYGITIESLDNPGWIVRVSISETRFEALDIAEHRERSNDDWIHIATKADSHHKFVECACGPQNLTEAIDLVLSYFK